MNAKKHGFFQVALLLSACVNADSPIPENGFYSLHGKNAPIEVRLSVDREESDYIARLVFSNVSESDVYLNKYAAALSGRLENEHFDVFCGDQEIMYRGLIADRRNLAADEYFKLEPQESVATSVVLSDYYPVSTCKNRVSVRYRSVASKNQKGEGLIVFRSNVVVLK